MITQRYRMGRLGPGDYLLLGNDGATLYRLRRYTDGPSAGLVDWKRDRELWSVSRYFRPVNGGVIQWRDELLEESRWVEVASCFESRRAAMAEVASRHA